MQDVFFKIQRYLLLDEPDSFLDYGSQYEMMNILTKLSNEKNIAVVMISHNLSLVKAFTKKIYLLEKNQIKNIKDIEYFTRKWNI